MTSVEMISSFAAENGCKCLTGVSLSEYTTFKIGGPAELMVIPQTVGAFAAVIKKCRESEIAPFILGNGSNLLISDSGLRGVTVFTGKLCGVECNGDKIKCEAGVSLSRLCNAALENSLTGLEFAFGIPGSVGGAVYMNAGAYGGEFKDVLESCEYLTADGELISLPAERMELSYRHSIFSENSGAIVSACVALKKGNNEEIRSMMNDIIGRRRDKQPLNLSSAGSTFKRPEGYFAGALIEQCGLKGYSVGGAQVSTKHAGFIVNTGGASCSDVLSLIEHIQKTVLLETGVKIETEIKVLS